MSEEGTVLLKNNGALPLSQEETQKISLLGFSSYYPVMGGDMGSSLTANEGTDADTVDFVEALAAKGFAINPTLQSLYTSLEPMFKTEVNMWGNIVEYYNITTPSTTGYFTSKEPSLSAMNEAQADWKDSLNEYNVMVVTLARSASENGTYLPGETGVDPSQDLNQADALGLSDDERDLVQAAIDAKAANGGKVIVLLNNASAMEVEELRSPTRALMSSCRSACPAATASTVWRMCCPVHPIPPVICPIPTRWTTLPRPPHRTSETLPGPMRTLPSAPTRFRWK